MSTTPPSIYGSFPLSALKMRREHMFGARREELAQHVGLILFCVLQAGTFPVNKSM
jgi:hypothetical protein